MTSTTCGSWTRRAAGPVLMMAVVAGALPACGPPGPAEPGPGDEEYEFAATRLEAVDERIDPGAYPAITGTDLLWSTRPANDWTSGFYPGQLWQMYEHTDDEAWLERAEAWQAGIEAQKNDASTHDIGFQLLTTFGNAYRLTDDDAYRQVLLTGANTLATRYDPDVGAVRSWDAITDTTRFRVIVDGMMNNELLFWAAANGGPAHLRDIAVEHALTTAQNAVRADGSTYHVVNYDQVTGAIITQGTHQGLNAESTWSRGQAWTIHGFTTAYRYTEDTRFLDTARAVADYYVGHLPADFVPYWDFELPTTDGEPRDSSAAAIAASGLLELSRLEPDDDRADRYFDVAESTLESLSSPAYLSEGTATESVLLHGTRHRRIGSFDTGLPYGDYYFLEAWARYAAMAED